MSKKTWIGSGVIVAVLVFGSLFLNRPGQTASSIKLGVLLSLTGDSANYGKRSLNGLQWAVEKLNAEGGISSKKIDLVIEDTMSSPKDAVAAINKLITVDKVNVIVGDIISGTTIAIAPIAEKNRVLLFAPGASHPSLRDAGDFIFRNWTSDDFDGKVMAQYLLKKEIKELGLIIQKTDYTFGLAKALKEAFVKGGGIIRGTEEFDTGDTDMRTQLSKLKASNIKHVYISAYSPGTGQILKQAKEIAYEPKWYASLTVDTPECANIAGDTRNGVVFTTPAFDPNDSRPEVKQFITGFRDRFGDDPEAVAGHAYDAINILYMVISRVGGDADDIRRELYKVRNFPGVTGITSFDEHGDVIKGIYIKQVDGNSTRLLEYFKPLQEGDNE